MVGLCPDGGTCLGNSRKDKYLAESGVIWKVPVHVRVIKFSQRHLVQLLAIRKLIAISLKFNATWQTFDN